MKVAQNILGNDIKNKNLYEETTLKKLDRGVYVKKNVKKGDKLDYKNIYFAFPLKPRQLSVTEFTNRFSSEYNKDIYFKNNIDNDGYVKKADIVSKNLTQKNTF